MVGPSSLSWTLRLGNWWGVGVRLHLLLFLLAVLLFGLLPGPLLWPKFVAVLILLASLLLHELAHCQSALRMGGRVDQVVFGPVGGLRFPEIVNEPEVKVFAALTGPLTHLFLAVAAASVLSLSEDERLLPLLQFAPSADFTDGTPTVIAARLTLWINWLLLVVNLLPVYPFDGSPALHGLLWPIVGRRTAYAVTGRVGMVAAAVLILFPAVWQPSLLERHELLWMPFVMLGIYVFFSARLELAESHRFSIGEYPAGHTTDTGDALDEMWLGDAEDAVLVEHREPRHREANEAGQISEEENEDARVDDILARLHKRSLNDLSHEELSILKRASQRYRERRDRGSKRR